MKRVEANLSIGMNPRVRPPNRVVGDCPDGNEPTAQDAGRPCRERGRLARPEPSFRAGETPALPGHAAWALSKRFGPAPARLAPLLVVLLLVVSFTRTPSVLAHAVLVRSDPAANAKLPNAPRIISLYFSEPLESKFSTAKVVDTVGSRFDQGDSRVDAGDLTHLTVGVKPLKPGFYSVLWTTLSKVDGHRLDGSYPFIVLNPDGTSPSGTASVPASDAGSISGASSTGSVDAVAYWLAIAGAVSLFGGLVFALAVGLPAAAASDSESERTSLQLGFMRIQTRLLWVSLAVFLVGGLTVIGRQVQQIGGIAALDQFFGTTYGQYWAGRGMLALIIVFTLPVMGLSRDPGTRAPMLSLAVLCAFGILAGSSLTSHGAAIGNGSFWAIASDILHFAAVGVWIGGLISLIAALAFAGRELGGSARLRYHAALAGRFSPLAAAAVSVILLTGTFNTVVEIPSIRAFVQTAYGRTLLIKLGVVLVLLLAGAVNAWWIRPRLLRAVDDSAARARDAASRLAMRLRRTVLVEAGFGVLVLLVTGFLLISVPSRSLSAGSAASAPQASGSSIYNNTTTAAGISVQLTVTPNKVGENTYRVKLSDVQGPVTDASLVRLDFTFADPKFGGSHLELPATGDGVYEAQAANFAQVGRWQVTTVIRRPDKDDTLTSFTVEVPDAAGNLTINRVTSTDPFASPSRLFTTNQLGGVLLVLVGILPLALRRRLWQAGGPAGASATLLGVGALMAGGVLFFGVHQDSANADLTLLPNPVPVNNESVAAGKALFQQNCAICHGETGHGDGPAAKGLNPQPVDLTVHVGLHADGVLYGWITNGIPRTAMPAWKDKLTDTQRWQIVNYLRTSLQSNGAYLPQPDDPSPQAASARARAELLAGASDASP